MTTAIGVLALAGSSLASSTPSLPDLTSELPTTRPAGLSNSVAPIYVDAYTQPGKLLYRFDTVIRNNGGTMDLYMDNGTAYQAVYANGTPPTPPDPNAAPAPGADVTIEDRSSQGAFFVYSPATGHKHWHFQNAARYELLLPGGGSRVSDKIGFCMFDTYPSTAPGAPKYFADGYTGGGANTWCNKLDPTATFTRMGISPTYGDLYASQASWQWIDVTGLKPRSYTLKATVNPSGYIDESDMLNNVTETTRQIPGTLATVGTHSVAHNTATTFTISGKQVAIGIPALKSASPCAVRTDISCYVFDKKTGPLTFAVSTAPAHGTLSIQSVSGLTATVKYTPNSGFSGTDSFMFTVTDARNLTSAPAKVTLNVS